MSRARTRRSWQPRFSYDPEADLEYTPDSVFCSHGAGYPVKWHQAREHMHLKVSLP